MEPTQTDYTAVARNLAKLIRNAQIAHPDLTYSSQANIAELIDAHFRFNFIGFALASLIGVEETIMLANKINSEDEHHVHVAKLLKITIEQCANMSGIAQVMEMTLEDILLKLEVGSMDFAL